MTCLSLVLMLALAFLGHLTMVAGCGNSADTADICEGPDTECCHMDRISVAKDMNPKDIEGKWYPVYKSHIPPNNNNIDLITYELNYTSFKDEATKSDESFFVVKRKSIYKNGNCEKQNLSYNAKTPGGIKTYYYPSTDANSLIKYNTYILEADPNAVLYFEMVVINGSVSSDYSTLSVMVKDPQKAFTLSASMESKLRAFCRPAAADISYFQKQEFDYSASC